MVYKSNRRTPKEQASDAFTPNYKYPTFHTGGSKNNHFVQIGEALKDIDHRLGATGDAVAKETQDRIAAVKTVSDAIAKETEDRENSVVTLKASIDTKLAIADKPTADTLSGATDTGKAVLKAADAEAARTAIGAGTSSFSGSWNDLTDKPALLKGDKGEKGDRGEQGPAGPKGEPGADGKDAPEYVLPAATKNALGGIKLIEFDNAIGEQAAHATIAEDATVDAAAFNSLVTDYNKLLAEFNNVISSMVAAGICTRP